MLKTREDPIDRDFLLWFAGFFDGEGWLGRRTAGRNRTVAYSMDIRQSIYNNGKKVMEEIQKHLGGGVYYYEPKQKNHNPVWNWKISRRFEVLDLLKALEPHLKIKGERARELIKEIEARPKRYTQLGNDEKAKIKKLLEEGKSYREVAKIVGRNRHAIARKVKALWPDLHRKVVETGQNYKRRYE